MQTPKTQGLLRHAKPAWALPNSEATVSKTKTWPQNCEEDAVGVKLDFKPLDGGKENDRLLLALEELMVVVVLLLAMVVVIWLNMKLFRVPKNALISLV